MLETPTSMAPPRRLSSVDDYVHAVGSQLTWNESRYVDFYSADTGIGGWFRLGMRPNENYAEMSACAYLPGGTCAFQHQRIPIDGNQLAAGGQAWMIGDPYRTATVDYRGPLFRLADPWSLADPKRAFSAAARVDAEIHLQVHTVGLDAVLGADQAHIDRIFLPGQADWHYQHLCWVEGTMRIDTDSFAVSGSGGKDHSWGPRNWLAKRYLRWFIAQTDDRELGFMLTRAVGPTKRTRSGYVWERGVFHLVDDFEMANRYAAEAPYHLLQTSVTARAGERQWNAVAAPDQWLPLRHRARDERGHPALLRIVKSPTSWAFGDGRRASGMIEVHDRIDDNGVPAGIRD